MEIANGIQFVQRGWANANMVLLSGGGETVVIDPGHLSSLDQAVELLARHGVSAETITHILITHTHWDHSAAADKLRALSGAAIGMGPLTNKWLSEGNLHEMWLSYFGVEKLNAPFSADFIIPPDSDIMLAGKRWTTISLPGHAPDTIGFFQPEERVLISADAIMSRGDCGLINTAVHGDEAFDQALYAADQIAALNPRVILPGHGPLIEESDVPEAIGKLRRRLERFKSDPVRHVSHLARRVVMASALELEPLSRPDLAAKIAMAQWAGDYAKLVDKTAYELVDYTTVELMFGGALVEKRGKLHAMVPR